MKVTSERISGLGTTVFSRMSAIAATTGAINLGQGFPDKDGPQSVIDAAHRAIDAGFNQYPPASGVAPLRESICAHQERFYGLTFDPATQVMVAAGASEVLAAIILGIVDPGDEVIVIEPWFDTYVAAIALAGGAKKAVTLHSPDFGIVEESLRAAVTDRTVAIIVNSPHNPTGRVFTPAELAIVARVATDHDLVVISDEVYEHLTFDNHRHTPIASLPGMADRTVTVSGGGKSFSLTGWKIGWATGPAELIAASLAVKQYLSFASGTPLQHAFAEALALPDSFFNGFAAELQAKRDLFCEGLSAAGLDPVTPEGTYFVTTDVRQRGFASGEAFVERLIAAGVVAIPMSSMYDSDAGNGLVRWAFCKRDEVLREALARIARL